ncbi:hypothetical protein DLAC_00378 [Tieghemostelium lacteum]|uniref:Uncharacterized protein n=1 Tax=Tieghemostelium lacteum TaxID=361077 RepID=A0A152A9J8_TIELA|nr:hypothetical protein DLAC_00378 [Tieghemostelium lacteum]|eukprot:KYR02899.1 hypothetical protein DLAC_00378 [Tieghemostelium lacteum]
MKFIIVLISVVILFNFVTAYVPSDNDLWNSFINWKDAYGIVYNDDEIQTKFNNYKETLFGLVEILSRNQKYDDINLEYPNNSTLQARDLEALNEVEPIVTYPNSNTPQYAMNDFGDVSNADYLQYYAGGDSNAPESLAIAGAALSAGVIAAITAAGTVIVGGAIAGSVAVVKKYRKSDSEKPVEIEMTPQPKEKRKSFIDIFNLKANKHKSITARSVPANI